MQPRSRGRHGQNGHPLVARQFAPATLAVRPRSGADRTAEKGDACDSVERVYLNAPIGSPLVGLTGKSAQYELCRPEPDLDSQGLT